ENRPWKHFQGVNDWDRPEGEARRIDDDARALIDRLVYPVDELVFGVRLPELQRVAARGCAAHGLDLRERRRAVDLRLAFAQPVEIRSVEHVYRLVHVHCSLGKWRSSALIT